MTVADVLPNAELFDAETAADTAIGLGGLRAADGRVFPLTNVKVRASLAGPCAHTVVEQTFANPFDETLDVTWIFPLPDTGAIVELELRSGDIHVVGECLERDAAKAAFDTARRDGNRAALVETEQTSVHTLSLTGLPARSEVTVKLALVELLPSVDNRFRWRFPTTIAPRYTPGEAIAHHGFGVEADTDLVPNASRLSPPIRMQGGTRLDLEVEIAGPLTSVESSLHAVTLSLDSGAVRVAPSARATLNKDFVLAFSTAENETPATRAWTDGSHTLVVLEPPANTVGTALPRDAVFTIDISGSMEGGKLEAAKTALLGALHGLQLGDRFKLIAFDDSIERFADNFSVYNDHTLEAADAWIRNLQPRGGTEMLLAVQESLEGSTPAGRLRTVLFITDGQSNDEARLIPAIANRRGEAVFFTLGIDTAVNAALLKAMANAGGGTCELCTPYDDIDAFVARLETRFGSPLLSRITAAGAARPDGHVVFSGRPASLLLDNAPETVEVRGVDTNGDFVATVSPVRIAFPLGALWAKERVSWLEERLTLKPFEEEAIRPEVLRIALQWHISSRFTSFVCVDRSTTVSGARRHVVQPTEMPEGWELDQQIAELRAQRAAMGGAAMLPAMLASPMPRSAPSFIRQSPESPPHLEGASDEIAEGEMMYIQSPMQDMVDFGLTLDSDEVALHDAAFTDLSLPNDVPSSQSASTLDAGTIARTQSADGSFGGDVGRTAAAVLALLLLGHTRLKGDRRRTVQKAADWLQTHANDARATLALTALDEAEQVRLSVTLSWRSLTGEGREGALLGELLTAHDM